MLRLRIRWSQDYETQAKIERGYEADDVDAYFAKNPEQLKKAMQAVSQYLAKNAKRPKAIDVALTRFQCTSTSDKIA